MKKNIYLNLVIALLILTAMSCKKAEEVNAEPEKTAFDLEIAKKAIEDSYKEFETAFNTKDSIGLANCYTTDAHFMMPNGKAIEGKPAIQKAFGQMLKGETPQIKLNLVNYWGNETNLTAENSWVMTVKDGKVVDEGKSIEVYKMEDGKWRMLRDCYNSNMPCPK